MILTLPYTQYPTPHTLHPMTTPVETGPLLTPEFLRRLESLELVSKRVRAGRMKGDRLSKRKGRGSEFADFRSYSVGDDLRLLDWNLYGRLEKLFIRLFLEEEDLSVHLLIETTVAQTSVYLGYEGLC